MKSLKAQLMAAIAMTLVAALAIGSSTFAWFVNNTTVSATGMQVKAQASGGLMIATYDGTQTGDDRFGSGFKASVAALKTGVTTLSPSSTADAKNWFSGIAKSVDNYAIDKDASYTKVTSGEDVYYLVNHFAISTAGGTEDITNSLKINGITVTGNTKSTELDKSLRIAVVVTEENNTTNKTTVFFAPFLNSTEDENAITWKAVTATEGTSRLSDVNGHANLTSGNTVEVFDTVPALSIMDVYIYYEGEDENCKTNNTINGIDTLNISVSLTADPNAGEVSLSYDSGKFTATTSYIVGDITYKWYKDGSVVAEAGTGSTYSTTTAGTYKVEAYVGTTLKATSANIKLD